jgi:hypothetical protein
MRTRTVLAGLVVVLALAAGGAPASGDVLEAAEPTLKPVRSCGALARYARRHSTAVIVSDDARHRRNPVGQFTNPLASDPVGGEAGAGGGGGQPDFSHTNVQEEGIDEPDTVKTDGARIFVVGGEGGLLYALDARSEAPRVLGSVKLPGYGGELLLVGDRILAITYGGSDDGEVTATILSEVDVSDASAMRVLRTQKVDGEQLSARLHGNVARVALWTAPREIVVEQPSGEEWTAQERRARRRLAVRRARIRTWRPNAVFADRTTGRRSERGAVPCGSVKRPRTYSGLGMLSVLTVDLGRGLPAIDADAVFAEGQTVYAGNDGMYVAVQEWIDRATDLEDLPTDSVTSIHKFAIAGEETSYRASGSVPGYMLSQWSMSEHDGHLRTATTSVPPWIEDDDRESESQVIVLAERDGALVEVGRAGGLGRGEEIFAVRFMGDRGFVVTFEQVDPLYALDLSVPERPRVVGELKIPGYSAYLHPVGEGMLLGVGQDADSRGRLKGFQMSLFDVSDLAHPRRVAAHQIAGESESEAEWDHRAFLYWPPTGLAVVPLDLYGDDEGDGSFFGAVGFRVDPAAPGIAEAGRIESPAMPDDEPGQTYTLGSPSRNLVIGQRLFSVWSEGVRVSRLDDLAQTAWVELPAAP